MPAGRRKKRERSPRRVRSVPALPRRPRDSHKGDYGRVLIVAGSPGMTGAATLAGKSALRAGAGLVLVACPAGLNTILEVKLTSCMTRPMPETREGTLRRRAARDILALSDTWNTLAIGPGLSNHPETCALVLSVLPRWKGAMVVDADALSHIATDVSVLGRCHERMILTPHPGEFSRLTGLEPSVIQDDRSGTAARFAREHQAVIVLKGHRTVVTDGERAYTNQSGNPGMATAGSGDVLTGSIGALLGQGMVPFDAARLGVHLHGIAGDLAARSLGEVSVTAEDILDHLPAAIRKHTRKRK